LTTGKRHVVGEDAVLVVDAQCGAVGAVLRPLAQADGAAAAAEIDAANNAPADPLGCVGQPDCLDHPDELVAQHATKAARVPLHQLQVGGADAGQRHADQGVIRPHTRAWVVVMQRQLSLFKI
jgi:hypothetical protein